MQPTTQKLRISQSNIEIDDILSDLQHSEQVSTQPKKDQNSSEATKQVTKP